MDTTTVAPPQQARPYQPFQQGDIVGVGEWFVTLLVALIPVVNIVMLFVWAFSSTTSPSKSNWAKATLIWMAIGVVLWILFAMVIGVALFNAFQSN